MYNNLYHEDNQYMYDGPPGPPGRPGKPGPPGPPGPSGGPPGPPGPAGPQGSIGPQGPIGTSGPIGPIGIPGLVGPIGPIGLTGEIGPIGLTGEIGIPGLVGPIGPIGLTGEIGPIGIPGLIGPIGPIGIQGLVGPVGPVGPIGPMGLPGLNGSYSSADFFALMPGDNTATIAPGADLSFPQNGPTFGIDILRLGASSFSLVSIGIYQVLFQVSITESAQLCIVLNAGQNPNTVVGRATGTSQVVGLCLVQTTLPNSILSIRNPLGQPIALTMTPVAGGTNPVSAHLVITRVN